MMITPIIDKNQRLRNSEVLLSSKVFSGVETMSSDNALNRISIS